ncbi:hypothetical protein CV102_18855 [Natronococcus pandeyae]|uniref:Uncharacterized protein n=1 Tax=Natronococcus pandeyae TaxID=2055836 RepID=A0A8J8Q241_9EURY|nr:hypothetical protein CV102_18855 [Natronococcus pandeyae]
MGQTADSPDRSEIRYLETVGIVAVAEGSITIAAKPDTSSYSRLRNELLMWVGNYIDISIVFIRSLASIE